MYYFVLGIFLAWFLLIYRIIHSPFGQVLQGDPRERAARDLARLSHRALQARGLRAVGDALPASPARTKAIVFQLASLTDVDWHDVGRSHPDDAGGRPRHHLRPGGRRRSSSSRSRTTSPSSAHGCTVIQGVIFVVCVLLFRRGIVGEVDAAAARQALGRERAPVVAEL